MKKHNIFDNN